MPFKPQKNPHGDDVRKPGLWRVRGNTLEITCNCGMAIHVETKTVREDGTLTEGIACRCGWGHESVQLQPWPDSEFRAPFAE